MFKLFEWIYGDDSFIPIDLWSILEEMLYHDIVYSDAFLGSNP